MTPLDKKISNSVMANGCSFYVSLALSLSLTSMPFVLILCTITWTVECHICILVFYEYQCCVMSISLETTSIKTLFKCSLISCRYMAASSRDMAESPPPPNKATREELLSKSVQELVIDGGQPPDNYVYKNSTGGGPDVHPLLNEIPVIDLGNLKSSATTVEEELEKLRSALGSWGCFQV